MRLGVNSSKHTHTVFNGSGVTLPHAGPNAPEQRAPLEVWSRDVMARREAVGNSSTSTDKEPNWLIAVGEDSPNSGQASGLASQPSGTSRGNMSPRATPGEALSMP